MVDNGLGSFYSLMCRMALDTSISSNTHPILFLPTSLTLPSLFPFALGLFTFCAFGIVRVFQYLEAAMFAYALMDNGQRYALPKLYQPRIFYLSASFSFLLAILMNLLNGKPRTKDPGCFLYPPGGFFISLKDWPDFINETQPVL